MSHPPPFDLNFLYALIRKLSETDRALILLYLDELSYQQIAAITGTNSNNVGVRISRIKQRLSIMANQDEETE
jgi:RNA polymerase sigma-70 factor (ECF subfamily)